MNKQTYCPAQPRQAILCAALLCLAGSASAVEGGAPITPFGVSEFSAAIMPPPSDVATVGVRASSYHASQLRDDAGARSPVALDLTVNSYSLAVIKMTNTSFLGGRYGYMVMLPVLDMDLSLGVPTPAGRIALSGKKTALGDIGVVPLMLQWVSGGLFQVAALQVQAPTGSYDKQRLVNPGSNHWTYTPTYAVSYIGATGFEVSSTAQINFNRRNSATGYRSGNEWQHEFALGQHVGAYTVGLGGYRYQQLSDDEVAGGGPANRARVTALGPTLNFFAPGSGLPVVWLHAYKEFGARNRSQGTQITLRAAMTF